jgi:hypothetical protein
MVSFCQRCIYYTWSELPIDRTIKDNAEYSIPNASARAPEGANKSSCNSQISLTHMKTNCNIRQNCEKWKTSLSEELKGHPSSFVVWDWNRVKWYKKCLHDYSNEKLYSDMLDLMHQCLQRFGYIR